MKVLVTGTAGFIDYFLVKKLFDNVNDYKYKVYNCNILDSDIKQGAEQ